MTSVTINSTEGRTVPTPSNTSKTDWFEKYKYVIDQYIQVGDPATYSCGSDSYAAVVSEVVRFKEGKRAGKVKYIMLYGRTEKFLAYPVKCSNHETPQFAGDAHRVTCIACWLAGWDAVNFSKSADTYWVNVRVGSQNPYKDPHF
jgi:hypothetical protein